MLKKVIGNRARSLFATLLAIVLLATTATPAFAAERPAPKQGTQEYYEFISKSIAEQVEYVAGGKGTPEYKAFVEVWYRPILQEKDLEEYTYTTQRGDIAGYGNLFPSGGDSQVMHDEIYRLADKLDILNPNLSTAEKVARIDAWAAGEGHFGKVIGSIDEVSAAERPWVVQSGGKTYLAGPLVNHGRNIDGQLYACNERATGLMFLYRLAGVPAIDPTMHALRLNVAHAETAYYLNGEWWFSAGRNYTDGNPVRFLDYAVSGTPAYDEYRLNGNVIHGSEPPGLPDITDDPIVDVNESWIDTTSEGFMHGVLDFDRYVHPEKPLTRGEVAKLLCNYLRQKPMRNEQVFSDVPTSHKYAPYIWAMHKLGILAGDGNGTFHPDDGLSMQEFAVMAQRMATWGKTHIAAQLEALRYPSFTEGYRSFYEPLFSVALTRFAPSPDSKPQVFADAGQIASWAKPAVDEFSRLGILSGDGQGYLKPTEPLSRLRFLVFLQKFNTRLIRNDSGVFDGASFIQPVAVF